MEYDVQNWLCVSERYREGNMWVSKLTLVLKSSQVVAFNGQADSFTKREGNAAFRR